MRAGGRVSEWGRPLLELLSSDGRNGAATAVAKVLYFTERGGGPLHLKKDWPDIRTALECEAIRCREGMAAVSEAIMQSPTGHAIESKAPGLKDVRRPAKVTDKEKTNHRWEREEIDAAIREDFRRHADVMEAVGAGRPCAKEEAKEIFGRNAVWRRLQPGGPSKTSIGNSQVWRERAAELGIIDPADGGGAKQARKRIGIDMAVEEQAESSEGECAVVINETIAKIQKLMPATRRMAGQLLHNHVLDRNSKEQVVALGVLGNRAAHNCGIAWYEVSELIDGVAEIIERFPLDPHQIDTLEAFRDGTHPMVQPPEDRDDDAADWWKGGAE